VHGIVHQSGGRIDVTSAPGHGTRFEIALPHAAAAPVGPPSRPSPPRVGGPEAILVVEDDASVREAARRILEAAGYRVRTAGNGREALEVCAAAGDPIDLVLTDVVMPVLGARGFVEELRRVRPTIPVVFMSGYVDDPVAQHRALGPAASFLAKPLTQPELLRAIREALDR
jgi:two-component system, cell cycle sensor histidine kinase and response regulator CckA